MPTGRVKLFNTDRGFGFILPDDGGPDVFSCPSLPSRNGFLKRIGR
jgi:cold shock protein